MRRGVAVFLLVVMAACDRGHVMTNPPIESVAENKPIDDGGSSAIDSAIAPCTDFYLHACGGWIRDTPIPDDEGMWSRSFHETARRNDETLRAILERDAARPSVEEPFADQLGDFYSSCLDETAIDALGDRELNALLDQVDTSDAEHLATAIAHATLLGVPSLFVLTPEPDLTESRRTGAVLRQPPLTLPESSYRDPLILAALTSHVTKMFELVGDTPARATVEAASAVDLERALADAFESRAVFRNSSHAPVIVDAAALSRPALNFPWKSYFAGLGVEPSTLHVATPHYLAALNGVLAQALQRAPSRDALRSLLRWQLLHALAPTLSSALSREDSELSRLRTGATAISPRWKRCVQVTEDVLGEALAEAFTRDVIGAATIERAHRLTATVASATREEVAALPWMDAPTRVVAIDKIARLQLVIGDPPPSANYAALSLGRSSFLSNVLRAREFKARRELASIGHPTRPTERIFAATPNASFDPRSNALVLLPGILSAPAFLSGSPTVDLATLGTILGHEMIHAIDGRFDATGNVSTWWSAETSTAHRIRSVCAQRELDAAIVGGDLHLRSAAVVDELLADGGGLRIAYRALAHADPREGPDSGTRDRAFFTGYAQLWCAKFRPEALRDFVATDAHPPPEFRVNESVAEMPEFAAAFSCKADDEMVKRPADRCDAW